MGQRDGFSAADIKRIKIMYECNGSGGSSMGSGTSSLPGKPIGTNKPRPKPKPGASGSGSRPKPVKPIRPIKPIRPASHSGNNGGTAGGNFFNNAAQSFMQGIGNLGSNLLNSIGLDENETGRSSS